MTRRPAADHWRMCPVRAVCRRARRRGGSHGSPCQSPFSPRILEHFIRFHFQVIQRVIRLFAFGVGLQRVPHLCRRGAADIQNPRHSGGIAAPRDRSIPGSSRDKLHDPLGRQLESPCPPFYLITCSEHEPSFVAFIPAAIGFTKQRQQRFKLFGDQARKREKLATIVFQLRIFKHSPILSYF